MGVRPRPLSYKIREILVAEDQFKGEDGLIRAAPVYKPHETANSDYYWVVSNERGGKGGITVFENETNKVLAVLNIEDACIPVVQLDGSLGYSSILACNGVLTAKLSYLQLVQIRNQVCWLSMTSAIRQIRKFFMAMCLVMPLKRLQ